MEQHASEATDVVRSEYEACMDQAKRLMQRPKVVRQVSNIVFMPYQIYTGNGLARWGGGRSGGM